MSQTLSPVIADSEHLLFQWMYLAGLPVVIVRRAEDIHRIVNRTLAARDAEEVPPREFERGQGHDPGIYDEFSVFIVSGFLQEETKEIAGYDP